MMLPNLPERITWYQERLRPEDPAMGAGISDWNITSEYRHTIEQDGAPIWGCVCSPSSLPELCKLKPGDVAAKCAHIIVRTPKNQDDLVEVERTLLHELGHVLVAPMQSANRDAEENAMHSLDHFFAKLSPEQGQILARSFQNPMARAYRAKEATMPEQTEEKDKKEAPAAKEDEKPPMMQVRSVAEIEADLIKAVLAGQPTDELAKEFVAAKAMAEATGAESEPAPPAPEPATMGMQSEEAYARKAAEATKEAIEAIVEANAHLSKEQAAMVRKQGTAKAARELVSTYPRVANHNDISKMGMLENPKKGEQRRVIAGGLPANDAAAMARQMGVREIIAKGPHFDLHTGRFVLGHMGPSQLRDKIANGYNPRKDFPATVEG